MESLFLEVDTRDADGKGPARRLRQQGKLPGVFYGPGSPATPVQMDAITFNRQIRGLEGTHLIELKSSDAGLNGKKVLVRDLQEHPVSGRAVHVDLLEVPLDKAIEVLVPLHFTGKPEGVTMGGTLQPILREVQVSCLPTQIPESIDVDVTPLNIGDVIHVNDIVMPEGSKPAREDNAAVVSVQAPRVTEKAAEGEEGEGEAGAPAAEGGEAKPEESGDGGDKS